MPEKGFDGAVKPKLIPLGNFYIVLPLKPKLTFGFGSFTPFGLSDNFTSFQDGDPPHTKYPGRYAGSRGRLESVWFQPAFAYRVTPNSSIAVGGALVFTHLFLESSFFNPRDDAIDFGREAAPTIFPGIDP